jgi:hypothetical protein
MLRFGPEQTKKRWSEEHAGQHLGNDLRLTESRCDCSHNPAEQENNRKLQKELKREMQVVHWTHLQAPTLPE